MVAGTSPAYGAKLVAALGAAGLWHRHQVKKGSGTPYLSHLLLVASLVLDDGGSEDEACAALLHDSLEDTPATEADLRQLFGDEVARLVLACTDTDEVAPGAGGGVVVKAPWKHRKDEHLRHLRRLGPDVGIARVAAADKLANARSTLDDVAAGADGLWERFKGGLAGTVWYLGSMADVLTPPLQGSPLARRLRQAVAELRAVEEAERIALGGADRQIGERLATVVADPAIGWDPADAGAVGFEVARRVHRLGEADRMAAWQVVAAWYDARLPTSPTERAAAIARLELRPELRSLVDASAPPAAG